MYSFREQRQNRVPLQQPLKNMAAERQHHTPVCHTMTQL